MKNKPAGTLVTDWKPSKLDVMKPLFPLLLMFFMANAVAEPGAYQVEVIVFRNLTASIEAFEIDKLRSFSHLPSLQDETLTNAPAPDGGNEVASGANGSSAGLQRDDLPDELLVTNQKSTRMDQVWRRLRSSEDYQPLIYAAWQQNRTDYYPPMRIHDQQIIDTQLRPPTPVMIADLTEEDPLTAYRTHFYRLDGSVQLRRSRFLHLAVDIEYREESQPEQGENVFVAEIDGPALPSAEIADEPRYGVFAIKQSRQVSTDEVQYFDTPYFGALILVTAISAN